MKLESERLDHRVIAGLIPPRSTVLDLGCGTGELLYLLVREKECAARELRSMNRLSTNV